MNAKRLVLGTLAGTLTLSLSGYLMFGVLFSRFYSAFMSAGSATGVERQPPLVWAVAAAMLSYGVLLTLAVASAAPSLTTRSGMATGAVVAFLLWFTADFMLYGISNVGNLSGTVIDSVLQLVPGGIAGGLVAIVLRSGAPLTTRSHGMNAGRAA